MRDEHGMLRGYTFLVMTSVILSGGLEMRDEHGMLRGYTFLVMISVILSGGLKMKDEHGMLRGVYISRHLFCHTFRWCENERRAYNAEGGIHFLS